MAGGEVMKRIKLVTIYHVVDSVDEGVFADKLVKHMDLFRDTNADRSHHESCEVFVETKKWEPIA
jgi:hypothetical protein